MPSNNSNLKRAQSCWRCKCGCSNNDQRRSHSRTTRDVYSFLIPIGWQAHHSMQTYESRYWASHCYPYTSQVAMGMSKSSQQQCTLHRSTACKICVETRRSLLQPRIAARVARCTSAKYLPMASIASGSMYRHRHVHDYLPCAFTVSRWIVK